MSEQTAHARPSATAIAIRYGALGPRRLTSSRPASLTISSPRLRHLTHGLMLVIALGVVWASTVNGSQAIPSSAPASGDVSSGTLREGAIVPKVVPITQQAGVQPQSAAMLLPDPAPAPTAVPPARPAPELKDYVVREGDNPYDLAIAFGISDETLLSANGLGADSVIQIGERLQIPPVSGVVVSTQPGDTVHGIADQWKISADKLMAVNHLPPGANALLPGEPLVIPDVEPAVHIYPTQSDDDSISQTNRSLVKPAAPARAAAPRANTVPAVRRASGNNFPWGQCTWWAAQQRPDIGSMVIGNAASWLYSARAAGLSTGTVPRVGAIVVYQPGSQGAAWTGHVAYVTSVSPDRVHFTVSEMNFPIWGGVTHRASYVSWGVSFIY